MSIVDRLQLFPAINAGRSTDD